MANETRRVSRLAWFIIGAVSTLVFLFLAFVLLLSVILAPPQVKVEPGTVMSMSIDGMLEERPAMGLLQQLTGTAGKSLWDIRRALDRAKGDDKIVAVRLDVGMLESGWGTVAEIQSYLNEFRSCRKPVYAYLGSEFIGEKEYAVALGADKIWLAPGAGMMIDGLRADVTFWRGTLDKLKIVPDLLSFKEYKSAGESLVRKDMSEYLRESLTALLSDMQDWFVQSVASRRSMDTQKVRAEMNVGLLTTSGAKDRGWVDAIGYQDEFEEEIQSAAQISEYKDISHADYLMRALPKVPSGSTLAVVFAEGPILSADVDQLPFERGIVSGPRTAQAIDAAVKDTRVKAIVLRINSPGGSAIGSDQIWRATQRARQAGKPVVATMSDVAGSGGYWIASGANKIVAEPSTITGSIGVVALKLNIRGFYDLIGATVDSITLAKNAGMMSPFESLSEEQRALLSAWMEDVYEQFKQKVATGRGLTPDVVEAVAKGRIWSGKQALERKLIDGLGGFDEAIREAKRLANIPESEQVSFEIYPKPEKWFERLFARDTSMAMVRNPSAAGLVREFARAGVHLPEPLHWNLANPQPIALVPNITIR